MATGSTPTRDRTRSTGAVSSGGGDHDRRKKRGGWLWWLLGLLALLLLGALLLGLLGGDDDEQAAAPRQDAQQSPAPGTGAAPEAAPAGAGTLTARNESLLPVPAGGLSDYETETATGEQVTVQSVIKDEGFWVGSSEQERVYVEYGGDVGADENQGFEPEVGDKVNLTGVIRPAPQNPGRTLNLPGPDARQVSEQGAYVNADDVTTP